MVNKQVIVTGSWTPSRLFFRLDDVELDPAG
jgi:hypothetical protein